MSAEDALDSGLFGLWNECRVAMIAVDDKATIDILAYLFAKQASTDQVHI